jgi:hypothetical protein
MADSEEPPPPTAPTTVVGRIRASSTSLANTVMNFNPQPGMWAATGTAIAYAPTLTELREPIAGGANIEFNAHGHSARTAVVDEDGIPVINIEMQRTRTNILANVNTAAGDKEGEERPGIVRQQTLAEMAATEEKHTWQETTRNGFKAAWKFVSSPTGFLMTIYGLNIVAWGAMLFFLLLGAAPAMNHPSKDAINSPRKIWIEIDSQILNALFCVTGFGLAPWRFRDLWWLIRARVKHDQYAMRRLNEQNKSWFRPPAWYTGFPGSDPSSQDVENGGVAPESEVEGKLTFTGEVAPPTRLWKLSFVVWMMILNTLFQAVLAAMMWGYNRIDRPTWSTGTFIGLGCGVSLMAGLMMWWEGRKVKKIEGPMVRVVEAAEGGVSGDERGKSER